MCLLDVAGPEMVGSAIAIWVAIIVAVLVVILGIFFAVRAIVKKKRDKK